VAVFETEAAKHDPGVYGPHAPCNARRVRQESTGLRYVGKHFLFRPSKVRILTAPTPQKAASIIKSWNHFDSVHEVPALVRDKHWTETSVNGLPPYIGISRLASTERELISYYHSALCFAYATGSEAKSDAQAIIYTPHGIPGPALEALPASGISQVAGLLHGLHEITNPKVIGSLICYRSADLIRMSPRRFLEES
jgi:hypothetical protein